MTSNMLQTALVVETHPYAAIFAKSADLETIIGIGTPENDHELNLNVSMEWNWPKATQGAFIHEHVEILRGHIDKGLVDYFPLNPYQREKSSAQFP